MKFALCIITTLLLTSFSFAVEYQSPRIIALGGAGRALPTLNDAIYLNPGFASLVPLYSLSAGIRWYEYGKNYNISVQDSRTELFQAGVGYTRRSRNSAINLGASKKAVDKLGVGLGGKIIIDQGTYTTTTDTILGTAFAATPWYYSGLVIDNLFQTSSGIQRGLYRTFYLANRFEAFRSIQFYIDPFYSPSYTYKKLGYSAGLEFHLLADFQLRMGQFVNSDQPHLQTRGNGYAFGVGWIGPRISLEYAFQKLTHCDNNVPISISNAVQLNIFF